MKNQSQKKTKNPKQTNKHINQNQSLTKLAQYGTINIFLRFRTSIFHVTIRPLYKLLSAYKYNRNFRYYELVNSLDYVQMITVNTWINGIDRGNKRYLINSHIEFMIKSNPILFPSPLMGIFFVTKSVKSEFTWESILDLFVDFLKIWPLTQWIFSLFTLLFLYIWLGKIYNRKLQASGGWISAKTRIGMIVLDLTLNLVIGMYYMAHRDSFIGIFMMRCPIAISPIIFVIEFVIVSWYYKKYTLPKELALKKKDLSPQEKDSKSKSNSSQIPLMQDQKKDHGRDKTNASNFETTKFNLKKDISTFKNEVSLKGEPYEPRPFLETRYSIKLQKTCLKKIQAGLWQLFTYWRLLEEPTDESREEIRKEINYRYVQNKRRSIQSSSKKVEKSSDSDFSTPKKNKNSLS
jgi:hypothetical protein